MDSCAKQNEMAFPIVSWRHLWHTSESEIRRECRSRGICPVFKLVDTCAAEFEAVTPYYYSTYEDEDEARIGTRPRIVILGGGPNRIGQGIEFDYCCCQAAFALRADGYEVVMVNSNPETVSTDYDTSDQLFFEPLTVEDVLNICERVQPVGVIVQFGGQTPLNLARALEALVYRLLVPALNRSTWPRIGSDFGSSSSGWASSSLPTPRRLVMRKRGGLPTASAIRSLCALALSLGGVPWRSSTMSQASVVIWLWRSRQALSIRS